MLISSILIMYTINLVIHILFLAIFLFRFIFYFWYSFSKLAFLMSIVLSFSCNIYIVFNFITFYLTKNIFSSLF